jgi:hypothetical protein
MQTSHHFSADFSPTRSLISKPLSNAPQVFHRSSNVKAQATNRLEHVNDKAEDNQQ